jgi:polyhydroxybutyrate depolymerase
VTVVRVSVLVVAWVMASCSASPPAASGSPGSSIAASPSLGTIEHKNLSFGGRVRTYRLFRPRSLPLQQAAPLILLLHGCSNNSGSGDELAATSHFDDEASKLRSIAAYPDAVGCWNDGSGHGPATTIDDFGFIGQLITALSADLPIDKTRVFVAGFSIGALMALRVACELSGQVLAVAAVAGTLLHDDPACHPTEPVSVLAMIGTDDFNFPYEGGGPMNTYSAMDAIHLWTTLDQCGSVPTTSQAGITTATVWSSCKLGTSVRLDTITGGHHTWFGSDFDPVPGEPSANTVVGDFLSGLFART